MKPKKRSAVQSIKTVSKGRDVQMFLVDGCTGRQDALAHSNVDDTEYDQDNKGNEQSLSAKVER